jgi:putative transposase
MSYDPELHRRRSIRLQGYDYASRGAYFITICTQGGACLLGEIVGAEMQLNAWGHLIDQCWRAIPDHFPQVELDAFTIMPNHVHGVFVIVGGAEGDACIAPTVSGTENAPHASTTLRRGSVGVIVGSFKSACTRQINALPGSSGVGVWQRGYWEHVIRNEASLQQIRDYIDGNAARWIEDQLHPNAPPNAFNQWPRKP